MTSPLVSDTEINALRDVALSGMQTDVAIYARGTEQTENGQKDVWTYSITVKGWFHSEPTPVITLVSGEMATVNTYRLFVPVGTAIAAGDHAVVGSQTYIVSDTTNDETWAVLLRCSLRLAE
jgi:hypothetical protein